MKQTRRSALAIMGSLIGLVKPLLPVMLLAVTLGTLGYLCAIYLTVLAGQALLQGIPGIRAWAISAKTLMPVMIVMALLRGILHYAEQYCNHFIAFKLLAIIRHKVFAALRQLSPAKLEGRDKGNLISILTTDIELLEVFYAHTISPIAIAILTELLMICFIGSYHPLAGLLAGLAYLLVGAGIPLRNGRRGSETGMAYRTAFGELNSFVLDSLRGLDETLQYGQGDARKAQMAARSQSLSGLRETLSQGEGQQRSATNLVILAASFAMLALTMVLYRQNALGFDGVLTCTIAMMGSFGPVVALSALSNNLSQTLASGERVLQILEEQPQVSEIPGDSTEKESFSGAEIRDISFGYGGETILDHVSLAMKPGTVTGIHGPSGSGKSTVLKLLMRFWDVQQGSLEVDGQDVRQIPTKHLRDLESYVTQQTHLFHDTIAGNIALAEPGATRDQIIEAAKKASLHDFILSLPQGYDTQVGELGETLSGGEAQRIGIARAMLHRSRLLLLDEPTSNLDSLNEGIILKSLKEASSDKTIVLVSHRDSTMRLADTVFEMDRGRIS